MTTRAGNTDRRATIGRRAPTPASIPRLDAAFLILGHDCPRPPRDSAGLL